LRHGFGGMGMDAPAGGRQCHANMQSYGVQYYQLKLDGNKLY